MTRQQLIDVYLDWRNNFLTVHHYAEYYGLHFEEASDLIALSRKVFNSEHPEA